MKCFSIILSNFTIIALQLFIFYICLTSFGQIGNNTLYLSNILDNWGARPFKNIELFDKDCPFNYEPIIVNKFALNCDFDFERDNIPEDNHNSSILRNHMNKTICIEKLTTFGYFKKNLKRKCGKDEKDCGYLDTLGHKLCVDSNKSCPINGVALRHNNENKFLKLFSYESSNKTTKTDDHYLSNFSLTNNNSIKETNSLSINENYSLIFTRENMNSLATVVIDLDIIIGIL